MAPTDAAQLAELKDRRIVLGMTGGVACYKAAELTRLLMKAGASVQVVMTAAAAFHAAFAAVALAPKLVSKLTVKVGVIVRA